MTSWIETYWSDSVPSKTRMFNILQISYILVKNNKNISDDFVTVHGINSHKPDDSYFWRIFPSVYEYHLRRIFFRLNLFSHCCQIADGTAEEIKTLKQHIGNLDKTLDKIWDECREAAERDGMNASWRSIFFDRWLTVEYHVKHHDLKHIKNYIKAKGKDWLNVDVMTLDWNHYDGAIVDRWLGGHLFEWNIKKMITKLEMAVVREFVRSWCTFQCKDSSTYHNRGMKDFGGASYRKILEPENDLPNKRRKGKAKAETKAETGVVEDEKESARGRKKRTKGGTGEGKAGGGKKEELKVETVKGTDADSDKEVEGTGKGKEKEVVTHEHDASADNEMSEKAKGKRRALDDDQDIKSHHKKRGTSASSSTSLVHDFTKPTTRSMTTRSSKNSSTDQLAVVVPGHKSATSSRSASTKPTPSSSTGSRQPPSTDDEADNKIVDDMMNVDDNTWNAKVPIEGIVPDIDSM